MMEFKTNRRYFHRSKLMLYIGIPVAVIGGIQVFAHPLDYNLIIDNIATVMLVVGALMAGFFLVSGTKDKDINEAVGKRVAYLSEAAEKKITDADKHAKIINSYIAESYIYAKEPAAFRKGSDGTCRTDRYSAAYIAVCPHRVYVYRLTFSLIEDNEAESFNSIPYADIVSVGITDSEADVAYGKKSYAVATHSFNIETVGGVIAIPSHNDSAADETVAKILLRKEKLAEEQ